MLYSTSGECGCHRKWVKIVCRSRACMLENFRSPRISNTRDMKRHPTKLKNKNKPWLNYYLFFKINDW